MASPIAATRRSSGSSNSSSGAQVKSAPFGYTAGSPDSIANMKSKIQNVVWILLENRAFDNILGGVQREGLSNPINDGPFYNPQNLSDPDGATWASFYKDFDSVLNDPDHSVTGNNLEFYGTFTPDNEAIANGSLTPSLKGFVDKQLLYYPDLDPKVAAEQVMGYYSEDEIPTLVNLVDDFVTFNHWHSCVPGPTNPNRLCALAGTAAGHGENDDSFDVSGVDVTSIFEVASANNISWRNYDGTNGDFLPDSMFFNWTADNAADNVVPLENFYQDAYLGLLPQLSYINPSCCGVDTNSMHPSGNVSFGQVLVKQIYDAVRNGPQWDNTLFVLTYDETGGFFDHVAPPLAVRPDNLTYTETAANGQNYTLTYDRLGGRMPTWLISPYTPKGYIEQYGIDPATGNPYTYHATSVLKTLGLLWDLEDLTPRVSHSPTFDHLIGPKLRNDTPKNLATPHTFANAV
ncbi:hypothetical protein ASPZODRAFT_58350 [Penicilliopsis zonata CBS 506.65]|uniref:Phospholipase C n=1 Tax=Penicilliopsis zonata CBS 506.65 TaxID=1073090 RepID=A0A1L9SSN7_9EURO|nr:hypothetical protein ASPZODRAFT_58350 [Penicilliopsis zonata CBS 506.65]OJJ50218.1 hypothetical protein ASPZODRAFT_58350 [Penicilliopsis zonata CBS 506.65]